MAEELPVVYRNIADLQFAALCWPCNLGQRKADRGITFSSSSAIHLQPGYSLASVAMGPRAAGVGNMRLLVVEDKRSTASYLEQGLTEHGFVVDVATNGTDGMHLALTGHYDLVLLDVMLPGRTGWEIIEELRQRKDTPVLFLTALDTVADRVKGLKLGADDYLVKPFAFAELLARIRTVLRRGKILQPDALRIADLEIDVVRRRVARAGQRIDLTAKEFALLHLLMRHQGEALSRTLIAEQVWDMHFDSDTNVVDVAIRRLRAKVDDPFPAKLIHTIRGVGYVCEART